MSLASSTGGILFQMGEFKITVADLVKVGGLILGLISGLKLIEYRVNAAEKALGQMAEIRNGDRSLIDTNTYEIRDLKKDVGYIRHQVDEVSNNQDTLSAQQQEMKLTLRELVTEIRRGNQTGRR